MKPSTTELLLESANFEPATIRRAATAMGHRTDASTRFEKSLDPKNTVLAIQRFVHLAKKELPGLTLTSRLSDSFPNPPKPRTIRLDPRFASRYLGRPVSAEQIEKILLPLEFTLKPADGGLDVGVPSFRAPRTSQSRSISLKKLPAAWVMERSSRRRRRSPFATPSPTRWRGWSERRCNFFAVG